MLKRIVNQIEQVAGVDIDGDGTIGGKPTEAHYRPSCPPPPPPQNLPQGWEMRWDQNSGRHYYVNHLEKKTQWEPPQPNPSPPPWAPPPAPPPAASTGHGFCTSCGKEHITTGIRFCHHCGCPVQQTVNPPPTALPAQAFNDFNYRPPAAALGYAPAPPAAIVQASGRRKALLIGINYPGTSAELRGCVNDAEAIRALLVSAGFPPNCITALTDPPMSGSAGPPTRHNILRAMQWLVAGAVPGDVLFFHFSGHGSQASDTSGMEADGYNETICPSDFRGAGQIVDDEIWDHMIRPLPPGVRLTGIMDCCHSGTGMDLPFTWDQQQGRWREDENPSHSCGDVVLFSGCQDDQTSSDGDMQLFKVGGAMTNAFIRALQENPSNPFPTYPELLDRLHRQLRSRGFKQRPQLSSSQAFNVRERVFSLTDGIEPNRNPQVGRIQRRKFRSGQRWSHGGQGEGAAVAALLLAGLLFS